MSKQPLQILIIDDSLTDQEIYQELICEDSEEQYVFWEAETGDEGVDLYREKKPDCVFLDYNLPDMDGLELLNNLAKETEEALLPAIMLTGMGSQSIAVEAMKCGAKDYLIKENINSQNLQNVIHKTIEKVALAHKIKKKQLELEDTNQILEQSNQRQTVILQSILDSMADGIFVTDEKGNFLLCNPSAEKILGINPNDVSIKEWMQRCNIYQHNESWPIHEAILQGKSLDAVELFISTSEYSKDGVWVSANTRPVNSYEGIIGNVTVFRDITEKKRAAQKLIEEKERLTVTLASMDEGVIVINKDKKIILFNPVAEKLTGWSKEEALNRSIGKIIHIVDEKTKKPCESVIDKVFCSKQTEVLERNACFVSKNNKEFPIAGNASPIHSENKKSAGVVFIFRDETDERELSKLKDDIVSAVSHEFRTPLTSIKGFTETMLADKDMPEDIRVEFLGIIKEESSRLSSLVEDLLQISRLDSGAEKILDRSINIVEIVKFLAKSAQQTMYEKKLALVVNIPDHLPCISGDEDKINSVFRNLLGNAIKFTKEGDQISISAGYHRGYVVVSIKDTGLGIPKKSLSKIFERFHRAHDHKNEIKGTGLGLAIVKKIVQMHSGEIEVESEEHKYTQFTVFLPALTATGKRILDKKTLSKSIKSNILS